MQIIDAGTEIMYPAISDPQTVDELYGGIEYAGRTCYKSTDSITADSAKRFVKKIVENHHEAMLEHASMTVKFIVDRGVSHELVRHRLASFAQESTRYCNYSKEKFGQEITVIKPLYLKEGTDAYGVWEIAMVEAEHAYFDLLDDNCTPQQARCVLPNSLKTEVIMTANMREWRHFFRLRAACETGMPHPQMLEVAVPLLQECQEKMPELFGDILIPETVVKEFGRQKD